MEGAQAEVGDRDELEEGRLEVEEVLRLRGRGASWESGLRRGPPLGSQELRAGVKDGELERRQGLESCSSSKGAEEISRLEESAALRMLGRRLGRWRGEPRRARRSG